MVRKSLSSRRVNWKKSSGQESSNGQEEADPPGGCSQQEVHQMALKAPD